MSRDETQADLVIREDKKGDISIGFGLVSIPSERDRIAARRQARVERQIRAACFVIAVVVLALVYGVCAWIASPK